MYAATPKGRKAATSANTRARRRACTPTGRVQQTHPQPPHCCCSDCRRCYVAQTSRVVPAGRGRRPQMKWHTMVWGVGAHSVPGMWCTQCARHVVHTVCQACGAHSVPGMWCTQCARHVVHTVCQACGGADEPQWWGRRASQPAALKVELMSSSAPLQMGQAVRAVMHTTRATHHGQAWGSRMPQLCTATSSRQPAARLRLHQRQSYTAACRSDKIDDVAFIHRPRRGDKA
jgi:hypothetical protein